MQAIILAAGMGRRLGKLTQNNTKCMVSLNGTPIITRMLEQLSHHDISRIVMVVGYKETELKAFLGDHYKNIPIQYISNPIYYKTNNIYSLALAKQQLVEEDSLLLESDLVFDDDILSMLVNNPYPNLALVAKYESWMDGTMVRIDDDNNIVDFIPKAAFNYKDTASYYKTANIYKFAKSFSQTKYVPFLDAYCKAVGNNEYYENVLRIISFLQINDLKALPITNQKWYEIDDKQDLDIAEALFAEEEDILKKYYGRFGGYWRFPKMLDYCYLVNPYFPSSRIMDEMQANFKTLLTEYPSGMKVNTLLASKCWGISEEYIIPGNGAAELIKILMEDMKGSVGITRPTFEEYPNRLFSANVVEHFAPKPDYRYGIHDLINFFKDHHVDTLILINPDNPSGNFIPIPDILTLSDWCKEQGTRLLVDESFVDFSDNYESNTLLNDTILEQHPNLMVMKSISKSYGVPGIRLGILASSDTTLIAKMKKQVSIWNLNSFAENFMQIFAKYETDYKKACKQFLAERHDFEQKLREIPILRVMSSQANYFLVEILPPYKATTIVMRLLKQHNILTRDCSNKKGFDNKQYMRISIRSHQDNERLIAAFKSLL